MTDSMAIVDLCGGTGAWSKPFRDAGHNVELVDPLADHDIDGGAFYGTVQDYIAEMKYTKKHEGYYYYANCDLIICAPPCTDFSVSGARHFAAKDKDGRTKLSVEVVRACLWIIKELKPKR